MTLLFIDFDFSPIYKLRPIRVVREPSPLAIYVYKAFKIRNN